MRSPGVAALKAQKQQQLSRPGVENRRGEANATPPPTRERAQAEEEFLRASVTELEELGPEDGEADKLAERRTNLQHREKILDALLQSGAAERSTRERGEVVSAGAGRQSGCTRGRQSRGFAGCTGRHRPRGE